MNEVWKKPPISLEAYQAMVGKEVGVSSSKIDHILLDRLDKVRKVMETNGTYVLFPQLGSQRGAVRVQGTEVLHVERTIKEIMALVRTHG